MAGSGKLEIVQSMRGPRWPRTFKTNKTCFLLFQLFAAALSPTWTRPNLEIRFSNLFKSHWNIENTLELWNTFRQPLQKYFKKYFQQPLHHLPPCCFHLLGLSRLFHNCHNLGSSLNRKEGWDYVPVRMLHQVIWLVIAVSGLPEHCLFSTFGPSVRHRCDISTSW